MLIKSMMNWDDHLRYALASEMNYIVYNKIYSSAISGWYVWWQKGRKELKRKVNNRKKADKLYRDFSSLLMP